MGYKKDTKNLEQRANCWRTNMRIPKELGGGRLRISLGTSDLERARYIRDTYIIPVMAQGDAVKALTMIAQMITAVKKDTTEQVETLKKGILPQEFTRTVNDCGQSYIKFIEASDLRASSKRDYGDALKRVIEKLDAVKDINNLSKNDAIAVRDALIKEIGATRLDWIFQRFRSFLGWCVKQGYGRKDLQDSFDIPMPKATSEKTTPIPKEKANICMLCKNGWTLAPRIARYTGMRLNEILNIVPADIVKEHGIKCIKVSESINKTHHSRLIPIADKLLPFMSDLDELSKTKKQQSDYNEKIKEHAPRCSFHSWRAYAISQMANAGIEEIVRKRIVGHKDNSIHGGYTTLDLQTMKNAVDKID